MVPGPDPMVETAKPVSILKKTKHTYERTEKEDTNGTLTKVMFSTDVDSDDSAICLENENECPPSLDMAPAPGR